MMEKSEVAEKIVMEVRADPRISSRRALVEALKEANMKNPSDWPKFAQKYGDDAKIMEDFASWQRVLIDVGSKLVPAVDPPAVMAVSQLPQEEMMKLGEAEVIEILVGKSEVAEKIVMEVRADPRISSRSALVE